MQSGVTGSLKFHACLFISYALVPLVNKQTIVQCQNWPCSFMGFELTLYIAWMQS